MPRSVVTAREFTSPASTTPSSSRSSSRQPAERSARSSARVLEPLALGQTVHGSLPIEGRLVDGGASQLPWIWATGGMATTTANLARFARAVVGGGPVSPISFADMPPFVPDPEPARPGSARRTGSDRVGSPTGQAVGMDGQGAGIGSSTMRLPETGLSEVVPPNMAPDEGKGDGVRDEAVASASAHPSATTNGSATPTVARPHRARRAPRRARPLGRWAPPCRPPSPASRSSRAGTVGRRGLRRVLPLPPLGLCDTRFGNPPAAIPYAERRTPQRRQRRQTGRGSAAD